MSSPKVPAAPKSTPAPHLITPDSAPGIDLLSSTILRNASQSFPYPTARALRGIQRAPDARERFAAVLKAAETLAVSVCACLAAIMRTHADASTDHRSDTNRQAADLASLCNTLIRRGATFGTWTNWLDIIARHIDDHANLIPALEAHVCGSTHTAGLLASLNALRDERNRFAHGDIPQSLPEYSLRAAEAGYHLENAVTEADFLIDLPWLLVRSSDYQPGTQTFKVTASLVMGGNPDFDIKTFTFTQPVGTDLFYLLDHGTPILLSPLVTSRFCLTCHNLEVCYPVHADSGSGPATMRSFERGHDIEDLQLGDEIRNLAAIR